MLKISKYCFYSDEIKNKILVFNSKNDKFYILDRELFYQIIMNTHTVESLNSVLSLEIATEREEEFDLEYY